MPETHTSCGVIPLRRTPDPSYLVLKYPQGHWGFPKGHLEDGDESLWDAATRELTEETDLEATKRFDDFREVLDYWFTQDEKRHHKTVYFFGCEVSDGTVSLSEEHRDYRWTTTEETRELLTYENEKTLFERWLQYYDSRAAG